MNQNVSITTNELTKEELRDLLVKAFRENDEESYEQLKDYTITACDSYSTEKISVAIDVYAEMDAPAALAYAAMLGLTIEEFNEAQGVDNKFLWDHEKYNSHAEERITEMLETFLIEDSEEGKWKRAPRTFVKDMIMDGFYHEGVPEFLSKYMDLKWAQECVVRLVKFGHYDDVEELIERLPAPFKRKAMKAKRNLLKLKIYKYCFISIVLASLAGLLYWIFY